MRVLKLHPWHITPDQAILYQKRLAQYISFLPNFTQIKIIAGVDASYKNQLIIGGIAILNYPDLRLLDYYYEIDTANFPYISGLLTFREGPVILTLMQKIKWNPDLIFFDGQGIAHPRKMGIATHLGLLLGRPTIGCAKSALIGTYVLPGERKGSYSLLLHKGSVIGAVVRTQDKLKPVFVSPGHFINLEKSIELTLSCATCYRLPEPIRQAHILVQEVKRSI